MAPKVFFNGPWQSSTMPSLSLHITSSMTTLFFTWRCHHNSSWYPNTCFFKVTSRRPSIVHHGVFNQLRFLNKMSSRYPQQASWCWTAKDVLLYSFRSLHFNKAQLNTMNFKPLHSKDTPRLQVSRIFLMRLPHLSLIKVQTKLQESFKCFMTSLKNSSMKLLKPASNCPQQGYMVPEAATGLS